MSRCAKVGGQRMKIGGIYVVNLVRPKTLMKTKRQRSTRAMTEIASK